MKEIKVKEEIRAKVQAVSQPITPKPPQDNLKPDPKAIPQEMVQEYRVIPISEENGTVTVACGLRYPLKRLEELRFTLGREIKVIRRSKETIDKLLSQYYPDIEPASPKNGYAGLENRGNGETEKRKGIEGKRQPASPWGSASLRPHKNGFAGPGKSRKIIGKFVDDDAPTVELVNDVIGKAVKINASDIHIEPLEKEVRIRYRMDGVGVCGSTTVSIADFRLPICDYPSTQPRNKKIIIAMVA